MLQCITYDARSGDADVQDAVCLGNAMEGAGHERVIIRCITENDELRAGAGVGVCGTLCRFTNHLAHETNGVHIDTGLRGAEVDAGADDLGFGERLWDRTHQHLIRRGHALLADGRETAEEIDPDRLRSLVKGMGDLHEIRRGLAGTAGRDGDRRDGDTLVDDRHTVLAADLLSCFHKVTRIAGDFLIDVVTEGVDITGRTVEKTDSHGDRTDIEVIMFDHVVGLRDLQDIDRIKRACHSDSPFRL